jgi:hypothetical protein
MMTVRRIRGMAAALLAVTLGAGPLALSAAGPAAAVAGTSRTTTALARGSVWQPPQNADWMWELGSRLNTSNARLMGTGVTAYNGDTPPGDNPVIYDIDAIINTASTISVGFPS